MLLLRVFFLFAFAIAGSSAWVFTAWNGVGCGEGPQNAEVIQALEGEGNQPCINLDGDDKAFSFSGQADEGTVIWAYHYPDCTGQRRKVVQDQCQTPLARLPCIRSWKIVRR
ncbi:uncharacterized protein N7459_002206 [Penicillium hispanicum]|uniref:uncharacterized protein n=1 Tax=Penicillium hispanicum TaxID=1080232 RepID=UPI00253FFECB|nr:uncharacterized protein N7459_002206 [Penicillium hispanicum]KAJ5591837.1 hypothetical protein N7459_002206 [Penicillium hispanicum]